MKPVINITIYQLNKNNTKLCQGDPIGAGILVTNMGPPGRLK